MRGNVVPIMVVLMVVAFVGAAYYYWYGAGKSQRAVVGMVIDKYERPAGTEAGNRSLAQGMRRITGQSFRQEMFYFVRVRTGHGDEVEMAVPQSLYMRVQLGEKVRRDSPDSEPYMVQLDQNPFL